jgi:hypothetical protein
MKREIKPIVAAVVIIVLVAIIVGVVCFMMRKPVTPQNPNQIPLTPTKMPGPAPPGVTPQLGTGGGQTPSAGGPAAPTGGGGG